MPRIGSAVMSKEGTSSKRAAPYVPLPFTTFGELLSFGLEIQVWCLRCHTMRLVSGLFGAKATPPSGRFGNLW